MLITCNTNSETICTSRCWRNSHIDRCLRTAGDVWDEQPAPADHPWRTMPNNGMCVASHPQPFFVPSDPACCTDVLSEYLMRSGNTWRRSPLLMLCYAAKRHPENVDDYREAREREMLSLSFLQDAALLRHYHGCPGRADLAELLPLNISGSVRLMPRWMAFISRMHVQRSIRYSGTCACTELQSRQRQENGVFVDAM